MKNEDFKVIWSILNKIDEKHDIYSNPNVFFAPNIFVLLIQNYEKAIQELKERLDFLNELAESKYMGDTKEYPEFLALFHLYHYKIGVTT